MKSRTTMLAALRITFLLTLELTISSLWASPARAACPCCSSIYDPTVNSSVNRNGKQLQGILNQNEDIKTLLRQLRDGLGESGSRLDFTASIAPTVLPDIAGELIGPDGQVRQDLATRAAVQGAGLLQAGFGGASRALAQLPLSFHGFDEAPNSDVLASPAQLVTYARTKLGVADPATATQQARNKVEQRRKVEYQNAVETAWAVGIHHLDASRSAPARLAEATRSMDGATDLRSQIALNIQVGLAVVEQLERTNELLGAMLRLQAATQLAAENLSQHSLIARPAVTGAPSSPLPWTGQP